MLWIRTQAAGWNYAQTEQLSYGGCPQIAA